MADAFEVVYLTGAPAAGKSTLAEELKQVITPIEIFNYGCELTRHLERHRGQTITHDELRTASAPSITPEIVAELDTVLLKRVAEARSHTHFVIDTHAVTKEAYGFRITPFSLQRIGELRPTKIVALYTATDVTIDRIAANACGRPLISEFEAGFHTGLQAAVAISYGTSLGVPIYLLDSNRPIPELLEWFRSSLACPRSSTGQNLPLRTGRPCD